MALANENSPYFHLVVFKLLWHSLEMSQKLLRPSVLEKELTGVIMTLTYTKGTERFLDDCRAVCK